MAKGGGNKSFVLRVDAATMEALEQWADDERRSGRLKRPAKPVEADAGADQPSAESEVTTRK